MDELKTSIIEYNNMWDAIAESKKKEQEAKDHPVFLGQQKLRQIKSALDANDLKKAEKLTEALRKFSYKYKFLNVDPRMDKLHQIALGFKNSIKDTKDEIKRRKIEEFNTKILAWEEREEERRRKEREDQAAFSISLSASKSNLNTGEAYAITITPKAGTPPFTFDGDVSYSQKDRSPAIIDFPGIPTPGVYGLDVVAVDAEDRRRTAHLTILVKDKKVENEVVKGSLQGRTLHGQFTGEGNAEGSLTLHISASPDKDPTIWFRVKGNFKGRDSDYEFSGSTSDVDGTYSPISMFDTGGSLTASMVGIWKCREDKKPEQEQKNEDSLSRIIIEEEDGGLSISIGEEEEDNPFDFSGPCESFKDDFYIEGKQKDGGLVGTWESPAGYGKWSAK